MWLSLALFVLVVTGCGALLGWLSSTHGPLRLPTWQRAQPADTGREQSGVTEADANEQRRIADNEAADRDHALIERVNACLPQTQCAQCGHPGCRPYAEAIIDQDAPINQCPPGGDALIQELAHLLGKQVIALDEDRGHNKPPQVALIEESACIGCTLCIAACPVDAIVGASKQMHTVIREECTGCELCLPPCPVDCIELVPLAASIDGWQWPKPA